MGVFDSFLKRYRETINPSDSVQSGRFPNYEGEQADSRRGAASGGYPVDKSQPEDPMSPGWNGDAGDDDDVEEIDYFPTSGGGDASGKMAYKNGRKGDGPRGLRDTGKTRAPESEGGEAYADEGDMGSRGSGFSSSEARSRVQVKCPHCGSGNRVRLPGHLTVVRSAYASEADASEGKILRTQCGSCAETVRFHAPEGHAFVRRTGEAARHFRQRYNYLTGRGGSIVRGLRSAREAFRRSYFDR